MSPRPRTIAATLDLLDDEQRAAVRLVPLADGGDEPWPALRRAVLEIREFEN